MTGKGRVGSLRKKYVPGRMDGLVGGWMDEFKSRFKDCFQQSKI